MVRRASCGLQRISRLSRGTRERATALAVSGEEAQHASLLRARAVPRWLWSVHAYERTLHRREASLLRRAAVVRRASCGLQESSRLSRGTRERATALAVSREEAQHASLLRARAVPRWLWSFMHYERRCTGERPLSFGARPWCDVPAAASKNQPAVAWHARARHCARCLSGGGAARKLAARARRAALVVVGSCLGRGTAPARGLSPSARGRGATCQLRPPRISRLSRGTQRARHCARCLSGGGAARELAARARRAALVVVGHAP